jgi:hypothetical protein
MKTHAAKHNKAEDRLISMAESIGSTMGMIVGRANAAQKGLTRSPVKHIVKREGKKLMGKSKKAGRKTRNLTRVALKRSNATRASRRG